MNALHAFRKDAQIITNDALRLRLLDMQYRLSRGLNLIALSQCIAEGRTDDGTMTVEAWSRDCDLCESLRVVKMPATLPAYFRALRQMEENAEGPFSLAIVPRDYDPSEEYVWDRAAEMMNY